MMEEFFFQRWAAARPALPQVYLPVGWSTYFFSAARVTFNTSEVDRAKQQVHSFISGSSGGRMSGQSVTRSVTSRPQQRQYCAASKLRIVFLWLAVVLSRVFVKSAHPGLCGWTRVFASHSH